jgi:hypothetical protein
MTGSPTADQVLVLIKFNIFRALCNNALMLGFPIEFTMEDNALSPFTPKSKYGKYLTSPERILEIPGNLRPTALQRVIPHHPWLDLLPVPRMRDNLILAEDGYDGFELCEDLCTFCVSVLVAHYDRLLQLHKKGMLTWRFCCRWFIQQLKFKAQKWPYHLG